MGAINVADILTMQDLANGHLDVKSIGELANGDENTIVTTRTGNTYPSAERAINIMFGLGGLPAAPFSTLAKMETDGASLADGQLAMIYNETGQNGLYEKKDGVWIKTSYDPLAQAKAYADEAYFVADELPKTLLTNSYVNTPGNIITYDAAESYTTYKIPVVEGVKYRVKARGGNTRFRVAAVSSVNDNSASITTGVRKITVEDALKEVVFEAQSGEKELYVYLGLGYAIADCSVSEYLYKTAVPVMAAALENPILTPQIADGAITVAKTDFIKTSKEILTVEKNKFSVLHNSDEGTTSLSPVDNSWNYLTPITPSAIINIKLSTGANNRFRVIVSDSEDFQNNPTVDRVVNLDNTLRELDFINTRSGKWLLITVNTALVAEITVKPTVTATHIQIAGLDLPELPETPSNPIVAQNYKLSVGKLPNSTKSTISSDAEYPRLSNVKYEYASNTYPNPVGYLYTTSGAPYEFLYSSGRPDNMEKLCNWNSAITFGENKTPSEYSQFIADTGDIINVIRGDLIGGTLNPDARQNPIIYPAGDYNNPVVVDMGEGVKPTAWARCNGITSIPNKDYFLFCEYTRPAHEKMYIWKVTQPYTNPANWQIIHEFVIDRPDSNHKEGRLKHFHALNYDPWSGAIICTTGDYVEGAKILMSKDDGVTWDLIAEGSEKHCRLSQVSFDEDFIYWGADTAVAGSHVFIRAPRDAEGYPDLRIASQEVLHTFPSNSGSAATYNTVRLFNPDGFLFLDRQDNNTTTIPLDIWFWSLNESKMHKVATFTKTGSGANGFRCDGVTFYQPLNIDFITVGFNGKENQNAIDAVGNSPTNRVSNLTLSVTLD